MSVLSSVVDALVEPGELLLLFGLVSVQGVLLASLNLLKLGPAVLFNLCSQVPRLFMSLLIFLEYAVRTRFPLDVEAASGLAVLSV